MVKVAEVEVLLSQSSVAVKVTVAAPVSEHRSLSEAKSLLQVTPLQMSDAPAPPLEFNQPLSSAVLPAPSHSTVRSDASVSILGAMLSSMVKVEVVLLLLPQASVAVNVTVALPVAPQSSLNAVKSLLQVTPIASAVGVADICSSPLMTRESNSTSPSEN